MVTSSNQRMVTNYSHSDQVYSILLDQIVDGLYHPNQQITEQEVASSLGVSRTPVREAFKMLERDGVLVHRPNIGVFVKPMTQSAIRELYEVRSALERMALKIAFPKLTPERINAWTDELDGLEKLKEPQSHHQWYKLDAEFHRTFAELSGNSYLQKLLNNVFLLMHTFRKRVATNPEALRVSIKQHRRILRALKSGELDKALDALEEHISTTAGVMIRQVESSEIDP